MQKFDIPKSDGSGGNMFLKLKDGESVVGVFRGDCFCFKTKWKDGRAQVVGENDPEGKHRFRLNFVVKEESGLVAKVFEFGLVVQGQLYEINEEYPLDTTKVKITRRGTGTDTTYMILPLLKEQLGPQAMKAIEAVKLHPLEHRPQAKPKEENKALEWFANEPDPNFEDSESLPF